MRNSEIRRQHKEKSSTVKKIFLFLFIIVFIAGAGAAAGFFLSVSSGLPDISANIAPDASSRIYDAKGRLITTVHAEENRLPVSIDEVPANLQNAFIAVEDNRFYEHHGVDPIGIIRAVFRNIISGNATAQGGSTITQQLARNAFLSQEQTLKRKLLEAFLALKIERQYTKKEILEMYMNQIYFGQGCYGIQTASKVYFGKDVKDLSLAQCALIAGLPNSPNYYSPFHSVEAAKQRQSIVLDQMVKYGYITESEAAAAKEADIHLARPQEQRGTDSVASYFVNYVIHLISEKYDSDAIYKEGLQIYTTLDLDLQKEAEAALKKNLPDAYTDDNNLTQPQGALVSIEVGTGYVRAMVGGRGQDHFNRAVQMTRQPGSAFKPFVYLTAFANKVTPFDILSNTAKDFGGGWTPKNYGGTSGGSVTVMEALVKSMNIPTVYLADQVGMGKVIQTAKNVGISTLVTEGEYSDTNLATALGGLTYGVSVWDMAKAYSVFANGGKLVEPTVIMKVVDRNGKVIEDHSGARESTQAVDEASAWTLTSVLEEVISRGTGGNAYIGRPSAGKTGTTDDEHDAWFVGYTPDLSTAVWVGDDTSTNAGYTGSDLARLYVRSGKRLHREKFRNSCLRKKQYGKSKSRAGKAGSGSGGKEEKGRSGEKEKSIEG